MPIPNSQRIIQLREQRAWNQEELAERAGLSARTIWNAENNANVQATTLHEIARALGIPAMELQIAHSVPTPNGDDSATQKVKEGKVDEPAALEPAVSHPKPSLLIVEDEAYILAILVLLLKRDYEVLTANSADAAEQVFRRQPVDIILADHQMPHRTGIELLEWVRSHSPHTVRLLMTGHGDEDVIIDAINRGQVYHYLSKPWRNDEVLHVLRNAAEKFKLEREHEQTLAELQRSNRELEVRVAERTRELEKAYSELSHHAREMERLALTDPLTRLFNRKAADALAMVEVKRHARYQNSLALGIIDIDDFKAINARYLLPGGDATLVGLTKLLTATMRETDSVGRVGGEKFLVIARETNEEGACGLAERIRQKVEQTPIDYNGMKVALTVSVGFAVVEGSTMATYPQLYEAASAAMLEAKRAGRNRCVIRRMQG
jgi:diguanylate cyclase (GGDEF)-like protein